MAKEMSSKRPKDMMYTLTRLMSYLGRHRLALLAVGFMVALSVLCNLGGTYMIRPVVTSVGAGSSRGRLQLPGKISVRVGSPDIVDGIESVLIVLKVAFFCEGDR